MLSFFIHIVRYQRKIPNTRTEVNIRVEFEMRFIENINQIYVQKLLKDEVYFFLIRHVMTTLIKIFDAIFQYPDKNCDLQKKLNEIAIIRHGHNFFSLVQLLL